MKRTPTSVGVFVPQVQVGLRVAYVACKMPVSIYICISISLSISISISISVYIYINVYTNIYHMYNLNYGT